MLAAAGSAAVPGAGLGKTLTLEMWLKMENQLVRVKTLRVWKAALFFLVTFSMWCFIGIYYNSQEQHSRFKYTHSQNSSEIASITSETTIRYNHSEVSYNHSEVVERSRTESYQETSQTFFMLAFFTLIGGVITIPILGIAARKARLTEAQTNSVIILSIKMDKTSYILSFIQIFYIVMLSLFAWTLHRKLLADDSYILAFLIIGVMIISCWVLWTYNQRLIRFSALALILFYFIEPWIIYVDVLHLDRSYHNTTIGDVFPIYLWLLPILIIQIIALTRATPRDRGAMPTTST